MYTPTLPVVPAAKPYRAGFTRRQLRNLRTLSGLKSPAKVRTWYDAAVRDRVLTPLDVPLG